MAQKEIAIKVKVEGQEISMTGKQLDAFKKTVESLKKQLELLGQRTEENGEQFDKLKGDLDALNMAFGETNEEVKDTTDSLENNETQTENNTKATKSYAAQIRVLTTQLSALGDRTDENGAQYDALAAKIKVLRDKQEDLQFGTKKLDDALSSIPGPIGQAASGFKNLDDTFKNARSAMKGLIVQFPILKNAFVATGIGAIVVIFGLLAAAVMKAFQTFKPLQDAVGKFGILFDVLGKAIQPVIDLIGKGLTWALEGLAKVMAFVTGQSEEFNKALADKQATEKAIKNSEDRVKQLKKESLQLKGFAKERNDANLKYEQDKLALEKDYQEKGIKQDQEYKDTLELIELEHKETLKTIDENEKKEKSDRQKEANEKYLKAEETYFNELIKLQNEKQLLLIKDQYIAQEISLKQQYEAEEKSIKQLEISEEKKGKLLLQLRENYGIKLKKLQKENSESILNANILLNLQLREVSAEEIKDEEKRQKELAEVRNSAALFDIQNSADSAEIKNKKALIQAMIYDNEITRIEAEGKKKRREQKYNDMAFDLESDRLYFENKLIAIDNVYDDEINKIKKRSETIEELEFNTYQNNRAALEKSYEDNLISTKDFYERRQLLDDNYLLLKEANEKRTYEEITAAIGNYRSQLEGVNSTVGNLASTQYAYAQTLKKGSEEQKKAIGVANALSSAQMGLAAVTQSLALVEAFRGLAKDIGKGFPTNLIAVASTLALIASTFMAWRSFAGSFKNKTYSTETSGSGSGSGSSGNNYGKNYAQGGEIKGKRHAQGGTLIEAEDGEAIMTRGAVSMFRPMLSAMNQMGGGKSFDARLVHYDNPMTKEKTEIPIIKTYVVSHDMTKEQEKYARLKDLSTL